MGEEFHAGVCSSTMSWWNTMRNTTTFDAPPPSFSCSKAIRDISHDSITWNQPFLPIEFDQIPTAIEDSSVNPLKEAFLPGFFEPDPIKDSNNELLQSSLPKLNPYDQFFEVSSLPKQQQVNFPNKADPFWEPSANFSPVLQYVAPRPEDDSKGRNLTTKRSVTKESGSGREPAMKKPRLATPSLLPTFKVRKEKLGDRITALQQLVSPFGKTDTASVLHEAIDYIKFLHDQVDVLTTPYFKDGQQMQHQKGLERTKKNGYHEDLNQNLQSQGLCLVPISSTFAVASEFPMDFWTPNFGGSYR